MENENIDNKEKNNLLNNQSTKKDVKITIKQKIFFIFVLISIVAAFVWVWAVVYAIIANKLFIITGLIITLAFIVFGGVFI
jgi:hypothetical protein